MKNLKLTKRDLLKYGTSLLTAAALPYPYQLALAKEQWDTICHRRDTFCIHWPNKWCWNSLPRKKGDQRFPGSTFRGHHETE